MVKDNVAEKRCSVDVDLIACACIRSGARHALPAILSSQVLYRLTVGNRSEAEESSLEGGMALAFLYY